MDKNNRPNRNVSPLTLRQAEEILSRPNGSALLLAQYPAELAIDAVFELFVKRGGQAPLSYLARAAKKRDARARINSLLRASSPSRSPLYAALSDENPKTRKNAARLAGALECADDAEALAAALNSETILFVIPSQILALGALAPVACKALDALVLYSPPQPQSDGEKKLASDIEIALKTALSPFIKREKRTLSALSSLWNIDLRHPARLGAGLLYDLERMTPKPKLISRDNNSVTIASDDYHSLFCSRCFYEALFLLSSIPELTGKAAAGIAYEPLLRLMGSHSGEPPYRYRIELKIPGVNRGDVSRDIAASLDAGGEFQNSVSGYELELRIERRASSAGFSVYAKLFTVPDTRFSYRKSDIPASINPVAAAAILAYARPRLASSPARVLDPCCGSGTLLIERERLSGTWAPSLLMGLDISARALSAARQNAEAARSKAQFRLTDCTDFEVTGSERFDEVIANLPFGNRVGDRNYNMSLYSGLVKRLPQWLKPSGTALLYTADRRALRDSLRSSSLVLEDEIRTEAGGLFPSLFILKLAPGRNS